MTSYILTGDVGGTNSRLQLFTVSNVQSGSIKGKKAPGKLKLSKQYQNFRYDTFNSLLIEFLKEAKCIDPPTVACLAVAGPVKNNRVALTNRQWIIDGSELEEACGIRRVQVVNDFLAQGYGLLTLDIEKECVELHKSSRKQGGPIACIGAGTGLGECYLTAHAINNNDVNGSESESECEYVYQCFASEGGHAEFSPRNDVEYGLLKYLKEKYSKEGSCNRVSMERVVAGSGLPDVYEYLSIIFPKLIDPIIHDNINNGGDLKAAVIAQNKDINQLCRRTMDIFLTHYGSEAGVACLKWIPTGGLFITGGNTPKNIDEMKVTDGLFMQAMHDKGRVKGIINDCPIHAVMVEDLGERGAHYVAYKEFISMVNMKKEKEVTVWPTTTTIATVGIIIASAAAGLTVVFMKSRK
jgi:glucokinase